MGRVSSVAVLLCAVAFSVNGSPYSKIPDGVQFGDGFATKKSSLSSSRSSSYAQANHGNVAIDGVENGQAFVGTKSVAYSKNGASHSSSYSSSVSSSSTSSGDTIPIGLVSSGQAVAATAALANHGLGSSLTSAGYDSQAPAFWWMGSDSPFLADGSKPSSSPIGCTSNGCLATTVFRATDQAQGANNEVAGRVETNLGATNPFLRGSGFAGSYHGSSDAATNFASNGATSDAVRGSSFMSASNNPFLQAGSNSRYGSSGSSGATSFQDSSSSVNSGNSGTGSNSRYGSSGSSGATSFQDSSSSVNSGNSGAGSNSRYGSSGSSGASSLQDSSSLVNSGSSGAGSNNRYDSSGSLGASSFQDSSSSVNSGNSGAVVFGQTPLTSGNPYFGQTSAQLPRFPDYPQVGQNVEQQQTNGFPGYPVAAPKTPQLDSNEEGSFTVTCTGHGRVCVPYYLCSAKGFVNPNGLSRVRSESQQVCDLNNEVCCTLPETRDAPNGEISGTSGKVEKTVGGFSGLSDDRAENNGYLPPTVHSDTNKKEVFTNYPKDDQEEQEPTGGENSGGPPSIFPPPASPPPQVGCAAALICVEEQYCSMQGVITTEPVTLSSEQLIRRVPLSSCKNPENGVIGKCCRDPNYVDPWPAGNLPANYSGGFDEQGFPTILNIAKTRPTKKQPLNGGGATKGARPNAPQRPNPFARPAPTPTPQAPFVGAVKSPSPYDGAVKSPSPYDGAVKSPSPYDGAVKSPSPYDGAVKSPSPYDGAVKSPRPYNGAVKSPSPYDGAVKSPSPYIGTVRSPSHYDEAIKSPSTYEGVFNSPSPYDGAVKSPNPYVLTEEQPTFVKNNYDTSSTNQQPNILASHVPGSRCGRRNTVQRPDGLSDADVAFGEIPWQAMVLSNTERKLLCSGAIVAPNAVVTAASCVHGLNPNQVSIKSGEWKLGYELKHEEPLPFEIVKVVSIAPYPSFSPGNPAHDIAVLFLEHELKLDQHVDALCLPEGQPGAPRPGGKCIATGWGKTVLQVNVAGALMHGIDVDVLNEEQCLQRIAAAENQIPLDDTLFCAKAQKKNNNMCQVDFGGPLACERSDGFYELAGIYNQDTGCLPTNQVSTFAEIPSRWIEEMIANPPKIPFGNEPQSPLSVLTVQPNHLAQPYEPCNCQDREQLASAGSNQYLPPV